MAREKLCDPVHTRYTESQERHISDYANKYHGGNLSAALRQIAERDKDHETHKQR